MKLEESDCQEVIFLSSSFLPTKVGWLWKETKGVDQTLKREETIGIDLNIEIDWEKEGKIMILVKRDISTSCTGGLVTKKMSTNSVPKKYTKKESQKVHSQVFDLGDWWQANRAKKSVNKKCPKKYTKIVSQKMHTKVFDLGDWWQGNRARRSLLA